MIFAVLTFELAEQGACNNSAMRYSHYQVCKWIFHKPAENYTKQSAGHKIFSNRYRFITNESQCFIFLPPKTLATT